MKNTVLKRAYDQYRSHGFVMNKSERYKKFTYRVGNYIDRDNEEWDDKATGYVAIIPPSLIIVDNDHYKDGGESFKQLLTDLNLDYTPEPFAVTPSGGEHYAFENLYPDEVVGNLGKTYEFCDIYAGYQSVIPIVGTTVLNKQGEYAAYQWADELFEELIINPWSDSLRSTLKMKQRAERTANSYDDMGLSLGIKADDMSDEEVDSLLASLPSDLAYDDWLEVGMALYDRYEGGEDGLIKFLEFGSRSPDKDDPDFTRSKWERGHLIPSALTYKRLRALSAEQSVRSIEEKIKAINSDEDVNRLIKSVVKLQKLNTRSKDDESVRSHLSVMINERCKELKKTGVVNKVIQARTIEKMITPEKVVSTDNENWMNDILYVESLRYKYISLRTYEQLSDVGVKSRFAGEFSELERSIGKKISIKSLVEQGDIRVCSDHQYLPISNEIVFQTRTGGLIYNTFRGNSIPKVADKITPEGQSYIDAFVQHLHVLFTDTEAQVLLKWMAWMVQNIGKKILWAPLIQSEQGLGKSLIGNILINHCFGSDNAGTVSADVVVSPQTGWATGKLLTVLEEVKLAGHNRHEVVNRLKEFVTNIKVSRVEKYEASSEVPNFCNFIALTNYKDAIPVDNGDRRWWIVYARQRSLSELEAEVGIGRREYFEPLSKLADQNCPYGAELHRFLLDYDTTGFEPKFAPESIYKDRMIATEESKTPMLSELRHIISMNSMGVTDAVLSTRCLKDLMRMSDDWDYDMPTDADLTALLRRIGYTKFPKKIKYKGVIHNVWVNMSGDDEAIKAEFHNTMELADIVSEFDDITI